MLISDFTSLFPRLRIMSDEAEVRLNEMLLDGALAGDLDRLTAVLVSLDLMCSADSEVRLFSDPIKLTLHWTWNHTSGAAITTGMLGRGETGEWHLWRVEQRVEM